MLDWVFMIIVVVIVVLGYVQGFIDGKKSMENVFVPTQETWLELEKFRWTHKMNALSNNDEEE